MKKNFPFFYILFSICAAALTLVLCFGFGVLEIDTFCADTSIDDFPPVRTPQKNNDLSFSTVVIDAGHGGEDGGASSRGGLIEKDINLDIALKAAKYFEEKGISVLLTRSEDKLLYDRNADFEGHKKVLDIQERLKIAKNAENSILISIHMNAFGDPKYSGLQVWYSQNDELSREIANSIQNASRALQPSNHRKIKAADSRIKQLNEAVHPSVLVECGFLSNTAEAERFASEEYRNEVAKMICDAVMPYLKN